MRHARDVFYAADDDDDDDSEGVGAGTDGPLLDVPSGDSSDDPSLHDVPSASASVSDATDDSDAERDGEEGSFLVTSRYRAATWRVATSTAGQGRGSGGAARDVIPPGAGASARAWARASFLAPDQLPSDHVPFDAVYDADDDAPGGRSGAGTLVNPRWLRSAAAAAAASAAAAAAAAVAAAAAGAPGRRRPRVDDVPDADRDVADDDFVVTRVVANPAHARAAAAASRGPDTLPLPLPLTEPCHGPRLLRRPPSGDAGRRDPAGVFAAAASAASLVASGSSTIGRMPAPRRPSYGAPSFPPLPPPLPPLPDASVPPSAPSAPELAEADNNDTNKRTHNNNIDIHKN